MLKCCLFQWSCFYLLGRLCSGRFCILLSKCGFSRMFHTERSWHIYRLTVVIVFWSAGFALWCKRIFYAPNDITLITAQVLNILFMTLLCFSFHNHRTALLPDVRSRTARLRKSVVVTFYVYALFLTCYLPRLYTHVTFMVFWCIYLIVTFMVLFPDLKIKVMICDKN